MRTYLLATCSSVNENTVAAGMGFKVQRRMCTQLCLHEDGFRVKCQETECLWREDVRSGLVALV